MTGFHLVLSDYFAAYGETVVLKDISMELRGGEIVAVIGANGSGKSTLLRALMGLVPDCRGTVSLNGECHAGHRPPGFAGMGIGYVPQKRETFVEMSVMENLVVGGIALSASKRAQCIDETIAKIPQLKPILHRKAGELSIGMKRLVGLARALVPRPRALFVDEPLAGLSVHLSAEILELIESIRDEGRAILMVEHRLQAVLSHSDRVYGLRSGKVVFDGVPADLRSDENLIDRIMKY